ncbi:MAG: thiamine pyrophosphate-binding protein [Burkholderiales bacterium]
MDIEATRIVIEALKEEGIDLYITLPEEPTVSLTQAIQADPYFTCVTVASEDGGVSLCAGASIGGRNCVFVTGIAGLLKGGLGLMHLGAQYGIPIFILASYRGDFGDRSGISGSKLQVFRQVGGPFLDALRIPYQVVSEKAKLKRIIRDAHFACRTGDTAAVLLLTGEVLW